MRMSKPTIDNVSDRAEELRWTMRAMRQAGTDDCAHYRLMASWEQFLSDEWAARTIPYFIRKRKIERKSIHSREAWWAL